MDEMSKDQTGNDPRWLDWARRLQATVQNGKLYTESPFDAERYDEVLEVAAEIMAEHSELELTEVRDLFSAEEGAATPKVDVRGVVFRGERILLVKETSDGKWTMPGGWANVNEAPSLAVVREVREETGFETRAVKLLAVYDRTRQGHHPVYPYRVYKLLFLCELLGGEATPSIETAEIEFFGEDEIPELSSRRTTPAQISRMFEHLRHPGWPADFD